MNAPAGRGRDLIVANAAALVIVVVSLFLGWREAAAFGLAVLVILDLLAVLHRWRRGSPRERGQDGPSRQG